MSDDKKTGVDVASIAGRIMSGTPYSDEEVMALAASCLAQAPDHKDDNAEKHPNVGVLFEDPDRADG